MKPPTSLLPGPPSPLLWYPSGDVLDGSIHHSWDSDPPNVRLPRITSPLDVTGPSTGTVGDVGREERPRLQNTGEYDLTSLTEHRSRPCTLPSGARPGQGGTPTCVPGVHPGVEQDRQTDRHTGTPFSEREIPSQSLHE